MQQFRKILVGVDLSSMEEMSASTLPAPTREAVKRALWLAGQISCEVTFLSVEDVQALEEELLHERFQLDHQSIEERASAVLQELVTEAEEEGVRAQAKVVFGTPWKAIVREVLADEHDLVLVGTRNRGTVSRLLFGSTALRLLQCCPVPVWITRPDPNWDDFNILVASDLSEVSQRALDIGVGAAQLSHARLHVLHVVEDNIGPHLWLTGLPQSELEAYRSKRLADAEEQLQEQLSQTDYRTLSQGVQVHVVEGSPDIAIVEAIEKYQIDLLVMGTAARSGLAGFLIGNTATRLLAQVSCSVLAVKPDDFQCPVTLAKE